MDSKSSEKRFALIIDADNVSSKYIKPITDELSKYGTITYKRIYGDWTSTLHGEERHRLGHDHRRHGHHVHQFGRGLLHRVER